MEEAHVHHHQRIRVACYQLVQLTVTTLGAHGAYVMPPVEVETSNEQSE